jgi:quercetin dioxygenase-like cupin family protein
MALQGRLRHPKRFITTHNEKGQAIVDTSIPEDVPFSALPDSTASFAQCYVTKGFPTELSGGADLDVYQHYLSNSPGLTVSDGTVLRYVDMRPGGVSPMHRTVSLDYGVVLEGEVELVLDSGETRVMRRGDICVQRGTMHAWRNCSQTEWARMLYVLQPVRSVKVGETELKEDLGGMQGVRSSS